MKHRISTRAFTRVALVCALTFAATLVTSCARDSAQPLTPNVAQAVTRSLTRHEHKRLESAKARTSWVGQAHHAGMQVVIAHLAGLRRQRRPVPKKGSAEYCRLMERVGTATLAVVDSASGRARADAARLELVLEDPALSGCTRGLAVFGLPRLPVSGSSSHQVGTVEVSGAFEAYLDPLQSAVDYSDGSIEQVRSGVDGVLADAVIAGIPDADLEALSGFASLIESSAEEWNSFAATYGGNGGCGETCFQMSVFPPRGGGWVLGIIGADALGCLSTVRGWGALKTLLYGAAPEALAGECGLRGAIASGGAIIAKFFR